MELVIIVVVLGIVAVTIIALQAKLLTAKKGNERIQVGAFLMQGCAEKLLAARRSKPAGYDDALLQDGIGNTTTCQNINVSGHEPPSVDITAIVNDANTGCPAGSACKLVEVKQGDLAPVRILLVNY